VSEGIRPSAPSSRRCTLNTEHLDENRNQFVDVLAQVRGTPK